MLTLMDIRAIQSIGVSRQASVTTVISSHSVALSSSFLNVLTKLVTPLKFHTHPGYFSQTLPVIEVQKELIDYIKKKRSK